MLDLLLSGATASDVPAAWTFFDPPAIIRCAGYCATHGCVYGYADMHTCWACVSVCLCVCVSVFCVRMDV